MPDVTRILEIVDSALDTEAIARRIRENLHEHSLEAREFPEFAVTPPPWDPHSRFPEPVHYDLQQAHEAYTQTWVTMPPLTSRLPLVGRIKRAFHRLVLYYVNRLASQQMVVNAAILRVLTRLVVAPDAAAPDADLAALQDEIAALRARVAQLEASAEEDVP